MHSSAGHAKGNRTTGWPCYDSQTMERVLGVGGVFLRARDPKALAAWYRENLGLQIPDGQTFTALESSDGDQTAWSVFDAGDTYFPTDKQFMLNYRVSNLDAMLEQLRKAGAEVDENVQAADYGKFGWATDPEGNRFELWEATP